MSDILEEPDRTVSATEARSRLSRLISRAEFSGDRTVLTRHGEPVAALVSLDDLKALQLYEDAVDVKRARESIEDAREKAARSPLRNFERSWRKNEKRDPTLRTEPGASGAPLREASEPATAQNQTVY